MGWAFSGSQTWLGLVSHLVTSRSSREGTQAPGHCPPEVPCLSSLPEHLATNHRTSRKQQRDVAEGTTPRCRIYVVAEAGLGIYVVPVLESLFHGEDDSPDETRLSLETAGSCGGAGSRSGSTGRRGRMAWGGG